MTTESASFVCFSKTNNYYKNKKNFDIKRQARPQIDDKKNKKPIIVINISTKVAAVTRRNVAIDKRVDEQRSWH
jgi:hypothetical protein